MNKQLSRHVGVLALAVAACAAQATPVQVTLTGWAFGAGGTVKTTAYAGLAGGFGGSLSGPGLLNQPTFLTYCIELEESFGFGAAAMAGYDAVDGYSYFARRRGDATIADRIGRLLTWVTDHPDQVDTAAESTSLQLAIWNLVYDRDYSVTTPGFRDLSAYRTQADVLLAGAQGQASNRYQVFALERTGSQDFIALETAVPEPGSLALAAAALGGLAFARRRRS